MKRRFDNDTASVDETGAREALVEQLAEAMHRACCAGPDWRSCKYDSNLAWERFAEAAAAQVEAAVSVVRAQVERANQHADEWAATADRWTHRAAENGRRAKAAEADLRALLEERDSLKEAVEYALHLRMYGERAPGGDETWGKWESMAESRLRALPMDQREAEARHRGFTDAIADTPRRIAEALAPSPAEGTGEADCGCGEKICADCGYCRGSLAHCSALKPPTAARSMTP